MTHDAPMLCWQLLNQTCCLTVQALSCSVLITGTSVVQPGEQLCLVLLLINIAKVAAYQSVPPTGILVKQSFSPNLFFTSHYISVLDQNSGVLSFWLHFRYNQKLIWQKSGSNHILDAKYPNVVFSLYPSISAVVGSGFYNLIFHIIVYIFHMWHGICC